MFAIILLSSICLAQTTISSPDAPQSNRYGIIISPDTTVLTGPLRPDGSVDYISAINMRESQGIASKDNAACLLARIIEWDWYPNMADKQAQICHLLGIAHDRSSEVVFRAWPGFHDAIAERIQKAQENYQGDDLAAPSDNRFERAQTRPWSTEELPGVAEWLKSNETVLALATEASNRPRYWYPLVPMDKSQNLIACDTPHLLVWRKTADALCLRSMLRLKQGDEAGALTDILTVDRLAALLEQSPEAVTPLVGIGMSESACASTWSLLQHGSFSKEQLQRLSADLSEFKPIPDSRAVIGREKRFWFNDSIQTIAATWADDWAKKMGTDAPQVADDILNSHGIPTPDWNQMLRLGNSYYDDLLSDDRTLSPAERDRHENELHDREKEYRRIFDDADFYSSNHKYVWPRPGETRLSYSNRLGVTILAMMYMPDILHMNRRALIHDERLEWTAKVAVALAIYRLENGQYPASLDALIPKYLSELPHNLRPTPIHYSRLGTGYQIEHLPVPTSQPSTQPAPFDWDNVIIRVQD